MIKFFHEVLPVDVGDCLFIEYFVVFCVYVGDTFVKVLCSIESAFASLLFFILNSPLKQQVMLSENILSLSRGSLCPDTCPLTIHFVNFI